MRNLLSLFVLAFLTLFHPTAAASGARGTLVVVNQRDNEMFVVVDGATVGAVPAAAEGAFRFKPGAHDVMVRNRSGETIQNARFVLNPGAVYTLIVAPARGEIEVRNGAGTTVRLMVDGETLGELASGQARVVKLPSGDHDVAVTYRQHGRDRLLLSERVQVRQGDRALLRLAPVEEGLVRVDNRTGRDATLLVDGRATVRVPSGTSVEAGTRLGRVGFSLVESGRVLASTSMSVGAYQDVVWRAEAPSTGDLIVLNSQPIPVLVQDSRGRTVTVAARSQTRLENLPVGHASLEIRRTSGEPIARLSASVKPYDVATLSVPVPSTGLVALTNIDSRPVSVWVDGVRTLSVNPRETARLALSLGRHRVQIRDISGRLILERTVVVDPFQTSAVSWTYGAPVAHSQHHGDTRGQASEHARPY